MQLFPSKMLSMLEPATSAAPMGCSLVLSTSRWSTEKLQLRPFLCQERFDLQPVPRAARPPSSPVAHLACDDHRFSSEDCSNQTRERSGGKTGMREPALLLEEPGTALPCALGSCQVPGGWRAGCGAWSTKLRSCVARACPALLQLC